MSTTVADPLLGRLLDDRYEIRRRLAVGGMATVYAAIDTRLDRPVAVKVMHPALAADEEFVARFRREAKAAARLSSPTVVNVTDQGQDGGTVFLVMELVEGRTLRDVLRAEGALPPAEALAVLDPILEALAAAHAAGYVHRDVKPENVLIADDGRIKVGDFGLARAVDASPLTATTGLLLGTVAYLAPEQVRRGVADARTDVYAAGVLLFEMLTGRPPYEGDTAISVAYQHLHDRVPAPSAIEPGRARGARRAGPRRRPSPIRTTARRTPARSSTTSDRSRRRCRRLRWRGCAGWCCRRTERAQARASRPHQSRRPRRRTTWPPRAPMDAHHPLARARTAGCRRRGRRRHARPGRRRGRARRPQGRWRRPRDEQTGDDDGRAPRGGAPASGASSRWPCCADCDRATVGWLALLLVTLLAIGGVWWVTAGRGVAVPQTATLDPIAAEAEPREGRLHRSARRRRLQRDGASRQRGARPCRQSGCRVDEAREGDPARVARPGALHPAAPARPHLRRRGPHARDPEAAARRGHTRLRRRRPAGQIISTDPPAGTILRPGTEVALRVSDGPAPVQVPNVVGQRVDDADPHPQGADLA